MITKINKFGQEKIFTKESEITNDIFDGKFFTKNFPLENSNQFYGGLRYKGFYKSTNETYPLVSIVMPNYNDNNVIKSIDSVLNQNYPNVELIVIDGGSNQEILNYYKIYNDEIDLWVSEKDSSLWDAWNKGFQLARGDYVGVVDSSNVLYLNALNILYKYIKEVDFDFFCGAVKKDGKIYAGYKPNDIYKKFNIIPSSIVGFYIKVKKLKKVGLCDTSYKIQADYDLLYRMIVKNKLKGIYSKSDEIFGDLGESGYSKKFFFFYHLINEAKIRIKNKQNFFFVLRMVLVRIIAKIINFLKKKK